MNNTIKIIVLLSVIFPIYSCEKEEECIDADGNTYRTVTIGDQIWMAENLKTTKYRDGIDIPNVTDGEDWYWLTTGAYCNSHNDLNNGQIYGRLYNWYAVISAHNICPIGWHVPSNEEWKTLITFLGGNSVAGDKLKETGTEHWQSPNTGATNESGFTALPGGIRWDSDGHFEPLWSRSNLYSSSESQGRAVGYQIKANQPQIEYILWPKYCGLSVRCIKD